MEKERIFNIPNFLTLIRGLSSALLVYIVVTGYSKITLAIVFFILMSTDALDGWIARKFNQKTKFGKYFDPVMDRVFLIPFAAALIIKFGIIENKLFFLLIPFIMTREIIAAPFYIFVRKLDYRLDVKPLGKLTTILQAITLPLIILELPFAIAMIILTSISGIASGVTYAIDSYKPLSEDLERLKS